MAEFSPTPESPDNEAIRELRDAVKDLNESTKRYSKILSVVAFAQLIVVIFQLIFMASTNPEYKWFGVLVVFLTMGFIVYIFKIADKNN